MTLALQLYSIRDALSTDLEGTIRKIAAMGYQAVEAWGGLAGGDMARPAALFQELGIKVISTHGRLDPDDPEQQKTQLKGMEQLGVNTLVFPWLPPENFTTIEGIKRVCEQLNAIHAIAHANGLRFGYHNHHFECVALPDGSLPIHQMAALLDPTIFFEVDTYWVQAGGANVVDLLRTLGDRAPLLHIKDGSTRLGEPMVAVGTGIMDVPAILRVSRAEALIVELDACATDMLEAVDLSLKNLSKMVGA